MKDSKARGLVLKRLYDLHHQTTYVDDSEFSDLPIERNVVANILEQLDQKGLAEWEARENYMDPAERFYKFRARITAIGIDGH